MEFGIQKITVQEMISGVEGQGSTYQFRLDYNTSDSLDIPESIQFNGKTAPFRFISQNNQYITSLKFTESEIKAFDGAFKKNEAVIQLKNGKEVQTKNIQLLEIQYLP